jgi:predicted RNA-binding protein YlxR (DUF448 family)
MPAKHVPLRRCVVCGSRVPQRELVRIVRTAEGTVLVDETAKHSGRGAYLCRQPECWIKALKSNRLAQALRTELSAADRSHLTEYALIAGREAVSDGTVRA